MKSDEMKAVVLTSPYQFKVQHVSIKSMKKEEDSVMLKVSACTLCGSDVKIIKGQMCDVELPLILGHEWTAEVVQAPQTYQHLVGKRIVPDILQSCGACCYCQKHKPNLCGSLVEPGISTSGGFAQYVFMRPQNLHVIPDILSDTEACLIEPLAVALYALKRVPVNESDTVMIVGGGAIGLLIAQAVRLYRPKRIILIDHHNLRLSLGKELAADIVLNPKKNDIHDFFQKNPTLSPTVAFEATGSSKGFEWCLEYIQKAGKIGVVGYSGKDTVTFSTSKIMVKLLEVIGVLSPTGTVPEALELVARSLIKIKPLITHILPLNDFDSAFQLASANKNEAVRVAVTP
jgi:2-desacetyl-2-hydroxyethyl bacteriochlorophyllide A dehydrogenase